MTLIDGVDDLVNLAGLFADNGARVFGTAVIRGFRNFNQHLTLTIIGAAMLTADPFVAPRPTSRGVASFTEPYEDPEWATSVHALKAVIERMRAGEPPTLDELSGAAIDAVASIDTRKDDLDDWANALATDADVDD